jgi:hypothetical protein
VKYETTPRFYREYHLLNARERSLLRAAVGDINEAFGKATTWPPRWPAHLRMKPVRGVRGVWEMTWSFTGPDGRATFQFVTIRGEPGILWRRIGGHEIFREP